MARTEMWKRSDGWYSVVEVDGEYVRASHVPIIKQVAPHPLTYEHVSQALSANGYGITWVDGGNVER